MTSIVPRPPVQHVARQPQACTQNPSNYRRADESQRTVARATGDTSDHEHLYDQIPDPPPNYPPPSYDDLENVESRNEECDTNDEYVEMKPGSSEDLENVESRNEECDTNDEYVEMKPGSSEDLEYANVLRKK